MQIPLIISFQSKMLNLRILSKQEVGTATFAMFVDLAVVVARVPVGTANIAHGITIEAFLEGFASGCHVSGSHVYVGEDEDDDGAERSTLIGYEET